MNRNLKIALGITVGVGLIYLGYRYFYKGSSESTGDILKEDIVHDKANREVVLVENN
jgi:hypothetical protein